MHNLENVYKIVNQGKACSEIQGLTSPFVDDMYELLNVTLDEYNIIIRRWPEYGVSLEEVSRKQNKTKNHKTAAS